MYNSKIYSFQAAACTVISVLQQLCQRTFVGNKTSRQGYENKCGNVLNSGLCPKSLVVFQNVEEYKLDVIIISNAFL